MVGLLLLSLFAAENAHAEDVSETDWAGLLASETGFDGAATIVDNGAEDDLVYWTVTVPYLDMRGKTKMGQGRLIIQKAALSGAAPLPLFFHCHYEKTVRDAGKWCRRGWVVGTVHYGSGEGEYPLDVSIGDSVNLNKALIQWLRRVSLIDRGRVHVDGGSQGGYMALTMAAACFPVIACTADVPVVNWAFNLSYIEANKPVTGYPTTPPPESPMPILCAVSELADENMRSSPVPGCYGLFGSDLRTDAWYYVSPISFVDAIACPVLVQVATGDMLVPHGQATKRFPRPFDPDLFPAGYQRDFETLTLNPKARRTLEDALGDKKVAFHRVRLPEGIYEFSRAAILGQESPPEEGPEAIDRPWDKDAQWNIAVYDEGPPLPHSAHSRYDWRCSPDSFVAAHQKAERPVGLLTPGKLERLMERYTGQYEHQPVMADGTPANRLNYPILEQLDVVTGLLDYAASGPAHAERLAEIYANGRRKPFGKKVDLDDLRVRREQLEEALNP